MDLLRQNKSGLVVTVDEAQLANRSDLAEFGSILQKGMRSDWPLVVIVAGLPQLMGSKQLPTYLDRACWHQIGNLDRISAIEALVEPTVAAERPMLKDAAEDLADESGGFPFAIQVYGQQAWRASNGCDDIDINSARIAAERAREFLEVGFFSRQWQQLSENERKYLQAIARLTALKPSTTSSLIAESLGMKTSQLSRYRDRLLKSGILQTKGNEIFSAVPAMSKYVRDVQSAGKD